MPKIEPANAITAIFEPYEDRIRNIEAEACVKIASEVAEEAERRGESPFYAFKVADLILNRIANRQNPD